MKVHIIYIYIYGHKWEKNNVWFLTCPCLVLWKVFAWAFIVLQFLLDTMPYGFLAKSCLMLQGSDFFWSTHFSGVGTVEQAARCLEVAGQQVFPRAFHLKFRVACDSDPGCRAALGSTLGGNSCILHDILARCRRQQCLSYVRRACQDLRRPAPHEVNPSLAPPT